MIYFIRKVKYMIKANMMYTFSCNSETLWNIITNNEDYSWRSDLSKIKVVDKTHFIEFTKKNYPTYFTITKKKPYSQYEFSLENTNLKGKWYGKIKEINKNKTTITLTEEIEVTSLFMKTFAKFYLKRQQKKYIQDLEYKINNI